MQNKKDKDVVCSWGWAINGHTLAHHLAQLECFDLVFVQQILTKI